jgi:hypothetical protein
MSTDVYYEIGPGLRHRRVAKGHGQDARGFGDWAAALPPSTGGTPVPLWAPAAGFGLVERDGVLRLVRIADGACLGLLASREVGEMQRAALARMAAAGRGGDFL